MQQFCNIHWDLTELHGSISLLYMAFIRDTEPDIDTMDDDEGFYDDFELYVDEDFDTPAAANYYAQFNL